MRCLAARVHYKTLIVICALLSLLTVVLWNKCTSEKALRFLPRHPQPPPSPKVDSHPQQAQPPNLHLWSAEYATKRWTAWSTTMSPLRAVEREVRYTCPSAGWRSTLTYTGRWCSTTATIDSSFHTVTPKCTPRESSTTPTESSCPLRGITWRCVTESSALVELKVSFVLIVIPFHIWSVLSDNGFLELLCCGVC